MRWYEILHVILLPFSTAVYSASVATSLCLLGMLKTGFGAPSTAPRVPSWVVASSVALIVVPCVLIMVLFAGFHCVACGRVQCFGGVIVLRGASSSLLLLSISVGGSREGTSSGSVAGGIGLPDFLRWRGR
jgi:hypothetical protein